MGSPAHRYQGRREIPEQEETLRVRSAGRSHVGQRRQDNEDSFLVRDDLGLYAVADGVRGSATGKVASQIACLALENFFEATRAAGWSDEYRALLDLVLEQPAQRLSAALRKANRDIHTLAGKRAEHRGMSTTIVAAFMPPGSRRLHLGHAGDSRCYLIREGRIEQLTRDHSLRNEALAALPPSSRRRALARAKSNIITRALGVEEHVQLDLSSSDLQEGDCYLLCSDGLHGMVSTEEIRELVTGCADVAEAAELLIWLANDAGGRDNITVVALQVGS